MVFRVGPSPQDRALQGLRSEDRTHRILACTRLVRAVPPCGRRRFHVRLNSGVIAADTHHCLVNMKEILRPKLGFRISIAAGLPPPTLILYSKGECLSRMF